MKIFANTFSLILGMIIAFSIVFLVAASSPKTVLKSQGNRIVPTFRTNNNGETYGSIADLSSEDYPDLIAAVGVDGNRGYFKMHEAHPENVKTLEEAQRWQEALEAKGGFYYCPLYDEEGNVIGKMQIGPNDPTKYITAEE